ncbi:predicted protein [Nematostella vectensis]|uniref:Zinc transporter ZIP1 n=1 Tax=Nematostella vectensis TaxID=45351 RepID=A7SPR1_NEMVE|nr:zinc transporter ZIP3 [Nematostella vectensis]EDO34311.1 predicted protein [Nematostella vectensis]|eukprot:XP_001626411.1 predicted protein [Nematostella vectensis]
MEDLVVKIIVIIGLFCITLICGILPYKIGHGGRRRQQALSLCNCFAAGVFFATSFLDLLPMIREKFKQAFAEANITSPFPIPEFTTCFGFFVVLIVEQVVHSCHKKARFFHGHSHVETTAPLLGTPPQNGYGNKERSEDSFTPLNERAHQINSQELAEVDSTLRTYILVVALSLHSIFEGLALGLLVEVDRLVQIAAAVVIHKSIIAFSMGVSMVKHDMPLRVIVNASFLFSAMGPLGIGIGIAVLKESTHFSSNLSSAILQGIANGTFIYVTFFEILQNELKGHGKKLLKLLFMVIGFSVVCGLLYFANYMERKPHPVLPHTTVATNGLGYIPYF